MYQSESSAVSSSRGMWDSGKELLNKARNEPLVYDRFQDVVRNPLRGIEDEYGIHPSLPRPLFVLVTGL
jgi:hypothetical protein